MRGAVFVLLLAGCAPTFERCPSCSTAETFEDCVEVGGDIGSAGTGPTCACQDANRLLEELCL